MKRLLAYLFLVLGFSFVTIINTYAKPVTIVSWGGAYSEMQRLGPADYAEKKTGIKTKFVTYSGGLSDLKKQKKSGKIKWDIMDVFAMDTINGCDEGLFHKFDFDILKFIRTQIKTALAYTDSCTYTDLLSCLPNTQDAKFSNRPQRPVSSALGKRPRVVSGSPHPPVSRRDGMHERRSQSEVERDAL